MSRALLLVWETQQGICSRNPSMVLGGLIKRLNIKQHNQGAKGLVLFTWDSPDDLRGVPQANKGELVEPPRANVPDFNWAPLPLVHYLFPGVTIWTASAKKRKWGKEQGKKGNLHSVKNSTNTQRLICIPFGKYLKKKFNLTLRQLKPFLFKST